MRKYPGVRLLVGLAVLTATVAGCSSGGSGGPVTAGSDSSSGLVAAAIFVQQWGQILWGLVANQTGTQTPTFGPPTPNPDGSISITFTGADGTVVTLTSFPDGSARLDITYPDGSTQVVSQSIPVFDGTSKTTIQWEVVSSDGLTVRYTSVVDNLGTPFDISDDTTDLAGTSDLPGGITQDFDVHTAGGQTRVQSAQSDGSDFSLEVPLAGPRFAVPDFSQPAAGRYRSPDFDISFTLESSATAPNRWARYSTDLGSSLVAACTLGPDFAGSGRLSQDSRVVAFLSWTRTGDTQVSFVSAGRSATSPAGAAVDFLTHRWQTLAGLLAPTPGASSVGAVVPGQ